MQGIEIMKKGIFYLPISIIAPANAKKFGLLMRKLIKVKCTKEQAIKFQRGVEVWLHSFYNLGAM
jgi:hypothetical protein